MNGERPALGGGWTLWRHALVRGAGFPFALVDEVFRSEEWEGGLRRIAADAKFREAVTWQNRSAVVNALDPLLRHSPDAHNAKTRRQLLLVARYLQRYCAKNDTIGFFGPVGWATLGGVPRFSPGRELLAARAAFFEPWAMLALAQAVPFEERLEAPVSLPGHLRLWRDRVIAPAETIALSADELRLLQLVDGSSAASLLKRLRGARWRGVLERLATRGLVRWEFPVAISLQRAEEIGPAAGDPVRLGAALEAMERDFERRTSVASRRDHSWGRGLVFEECRRDLSMDLGSAALSRIAPALQLVLRIARWYTFTIATRLARSLLREHRASGRARVPLPEFWLRTEPLFGEEIVQAVAERLRVRLRKLWSLGEHLDIRDARAFVTRHFSAPCPGWPGARHHAPDVMWDAPSPEALLAGEGTPVLSELHPGVTPFTTLSVLSLCPVRDELAREWDLDFPEPLVSPIPWEEYARSTHDARLAKHHWHLDLGDPYASDRPPDQILRAADFDVVESDGRLFAVQRKGKLRLDLLTVFERRIKLRAATAFSLSDGSPMGPRRYLGPLVVERAHWRVESLPFVARVREWRDSLALPERVFIRVPSEVKPIYVDLTSPVSIEMLVRFAREAPHVSISEMLPGPEGLWLRDGDGNAYTSELRMIAVDPKSWDGGRVWGYGVR
ncbi:MAG TPA: lantibiotic dehydratase [Thermoanaerobaculia bacterium]|nr:lantibiotic dehydratase [Thermoanaerobaculia bacterium]